MYNFRNDYNVICHERVLKSLVNEGYNTFDGYGLDETSNKAIKEIKKYISRDVDIHFLNGGTACNKTVLSHILLPYEAVICASTGHINVHETGTIENSGHKILTVPSHNGKIKVDDVKETLTSHTDEHMVKPKVIYISNSTETGDVYSKNELEEIHKFAVENDLYLYLDGARLSSAMAKEDLTLDDFANLCDVFYIGGTKNGLLFGESLVIVNDKLKKDFRFSMKQNGAMSAKGFIIGLGFFELFKDGLYFEIGKMENNLATNLYNGLKTRGFEFDGEPKSNQLFVKVSNDKYNILSEFVNFELWKDLKDFKIIRFVTSFHMNDSYIDDFLSELDRRTI